MCEHSEDYEVKTMCRALGVKASSYYAWRRRGVSQRERANQVLKEQIVAVHQASRASYGSPRVHAALRQQGVTCTRKRVERLMHLHGIQGLSRRRRRTATTDSKHSLPVAPNLLNRNFTASRPNQKWLADITYIDTLEGCLYLASVEDVFSRRIVGWAMDEHMETSLVNAALHMALFQRRPADGLLHHSDRGSQYASHHYQALLARRHITVSMSRSANCYDNAMLESFHATLKTECATQPFASRAAARLAIFEFIEVWYNRHRLHSALGYQSPEQFEQSFISPLP